MSKDYKVKVACARGRCYCVAGYGGASRWGEREGNPSENKKKKIMRLKKRKWP